MYPPRSRHNDDSTSTSTGDQEQDWHTWGRPSGGFIDLGCGNGLLVHILVAEVNYLHCPAKLERDIANFVLPLIGISRRRLRAES